MWFVTLVKGLHPPSKEDAMKMQEHMKTAESWGVKFHQGFMTLGPYDAVWISEAPDEKTALKVSMMFSTMGGSATTMAAVSNEEVMSWAAKMM
jgi:uncharacterized protein with GYD domain